MKIDFVQEVVDEERHVFAGLLTGWETIVFQLEDEPEPPDQKIGFDCS